eukprot:UN34842
MTKSLLKIVTPIEEEWLWSEAPKLKWLISPKDLEAKTKDVLVEVAIDKKEYPPACYKEFIGPNRSKLQSYELKYGVTIDANDGNVKIWCTESKTYEIRATFLSIFKGIRNRIRNETQEIRLSDVLGTRLWVGAGMRIGQVLFPAEFNAIEMQILGPICE